ncbi:unnamed protein product [Paramecium sonneborni]|uniref:Uncharacterized protein n=1 Tax=Paramecium sonneborni TaxID=65129 RepID=A0A8S1RUA0_9CILI|nr:unnamed protein product [Paramecium sonneborni]
MDRAFEWILEVQYFQRFSDSQVIYKGEYKNSKKYGSWDIYYQKQYGNYKNEQMLLQIIKHYSGGGSFDDENLKNGKWIELN